MHKVKRYRWLLTCALLTAIPGVASSITDFSFTTDSSPFTSSLLASFSSSAANLDGTIACNSTSACSAEVGTFSIDADFTAFTPVFVELLQSPSGTFGEYPISFLTINVTSPAQFALSEPFGCSPGTCAYSPLELFDAPPLGDVILQGSVDLTLSAGQSLNLQQLTFTEGPIPEPRMVLLLTFLLAALPLIRRALNSK